MILRLKETGAFLDISGCGRCAHPDRTYRSWNCDQLKCRLAGSMARGKNRQP